MTIMILTVALTAAWISLPGGGGKQDAGSATSQPATRSRAGASALRKPEQVAVLKKLLDRDIRDEQILPRRPEKRDQRGTRALGGSTDASQSLLIEGETIFDRPGRLVVGAERTEFVFLAVEGDVSLRTMEVNKSGLLEAMEMDRASGIKEFVISATVTRYRNKNYLNLLKVSRRVRHGNLAP